MVEKYHESGIGRKESSLYDLMPIGEHSEFWKAGRRLHPARDYSASVVSMPAVESINP
jgi:hypothetical protein